MVVTQQNTQASSFISGHTRGPDGRVLKDGTGDAYPTSSPPLSEMQKVCVLTSSTSEQGVVGCKTQRDKKQVSMGGMEEGAVWAEGQSGRLGSGSLGPETLGLGAPSPLGRSQ